VRRQAQVSIPTTEIEPMPQSETFTWLHLSDLHVGKSNEFDENVVYKALLKDISKEIDEKGLQPDLLIFSGDLVFSGKSDQYSEACQQLDKLLLKLKLPQERLLIVPGNHDVDRDKVTSGAKTIGNSLTDNNRTNSVLNTPSDLRLTLSGLEHFAQFVNSYFPGCNRFDDAKYFSVDRFDVRGHKIAVLSLNSAWLCHSDETRQAGIVVGELQVRKALELAEGAGVKLAVLHHPLESLREFDRLKSARILTNDCDFILHGHLHRTSASQTITPDGGAIIIGSGACYETPDYPNSYNFVRLDLATGHGSIYMRRYSPEGKGFFAADTLSYENAPEGVHGFTWRRSPGL